MRVVLKFPVDVREPKLELPVGSKILLVAHEPALPRWKVTIWAECIVDTDNQGRPDVHASPMQNRELLIFGTGHPMPVETDIVHLGSVLTHDPIEGQMVWHVYERVRARHD